jgi:RNA polymerase sigma-70 factor (ECF subfamily)
VTGSGGTPDPVLGLFHGRESAVTLVPVPRFEDFYGAYFNALVVQLTPYVGDMSDAQDVVQEAFCRAWSRWDKVARYDDPAAWVRRVAWNLANSRWRRIKVRLLFQRSQRLETAQGPNPDRVAVERALATLSPNHRRAVMLHYLVGLSISEIAADCQAPESTVKSWLHRGRARLGAALAADDEGATLHD